MAASPIPRFEELPAEEPEVFLPPERRAAAPEPLTREDRLEAVEEQGRIDASWFNQTLSSGAQGRIQDPNFIDGLASRYPELSRDEVQQAYARGVNDMFQTPELSAELQAKVEAFTARYGNTALEMLGLEPAADRVQMITRGRELYEQEHFNGNSEGRWTLQQFSTNPAGEPWLALQERDTYGDVQRTFTGTRAEMDQLISDHKLTVTELPAITEGEYYRQAVGRMGLEPEIRQEEGFSVSV